VDAHRLEAIEGFQSQALRSLGRIVDFGFNESPNGICGADEVLLVGDIAPFPSAVFSTFPLRRMPLTTGCQSPDPWPHMQANLHLFDHLHRRIDESAHTLHRCCAP
jgi:hypothetical protein